MNIEAYASGDCDDFLSYIIVFRNGKIHKLWDVRETKTRHLSKSLEIRESENAWYVVKVYGKDAQIKTENLDVMQICDQIAKGEFKDKLMNESNVCLTSPFYFGERNSITLQSNVNLKLIDPSTKESVKNATIEVSIDDSVYSILTTKNGRINFDMPVNALLKIQADGYPTVQRGLYLDYEPHEKMIETFANGDWLNQHNWKNILVPGQVPLEAFQFEKTKQVLSNVDWTIEMQKNERDELWSTFDSIFD